MDFVSSKYDSLKVSPSFLASDFKAEEQEVSIVLRRWWLVLAIWEQM